MIKENVPLAPLTTFRLGGAARFFIEVQTLEELNTALDTAKEKNLPVLFLGGGSNMLVTESGFDGLVIKVALKGIERDEALLIASAGESWDALVEYSVAAGLWGLENLSGIPGSVGAAPIQNIGAYGSEVKDTVLWVEVLDSQTNSVRMLTAAECGFGYRTSNFKKNPGRYVVLRVAFALHTDPSARLHYKDLAEAFDGNTSPSADEIRTAVLKIRARKFPNLAEEGTAGSFFLNPVVSPGIAATLSAAYPGLPQYPAEGTVKLSLAWLLDNALGVKGVRVGGARLFERQPLVIAATRDATAQDVVTLKEKIKTLAKEKLQLDLEEEVRII